MSNQENEIVEASLSSKTEKTSNPTTPTIEEDTTSTPETKVTKTPTTNNEQDKPRRISMPQDVRYATEASDREKLLEKYNQYQPSDVNACHLRFVIDHRQKRNLLGRNEEETSNLNNISKDFNVNFQLGYQNMAKHSFKITGTEVNVQRCLVELINRMFKSPNRSNGQNEKPQSSPSPVDKAQESNQKEKSDERTSASPPTTTIFVTTINADSSITEEKKPLTPSTPTINDDERLKYVPLERKTEYTFTMLITSQGQEVLKKNWSFFAGLLQQRLNVVVSNPFKLPKFGDKQWQNELSITGDRVENLVDASLQLTAFINDVLGIAPHVYNAQEEQNFGDHNNYPRSKNEHSQGRRLDYNNSYRQSPSSPYSNYNDRTYFNRGRQGIYEQMILIRNNCVARIVGSRGSNLRRIQGKCHLRDINVARHANENGYVECTLSAYQTRHLNFALDTIHSYLRNEDEQAIQVFEANYVDLPLQSSPFQNSPHHDQPQLSVHNHEQSFPNQRYQQQKQMSLTDPSESRSNNPRETGFMTGPLNIPNGNQYPQPSYNFQNTPSFDFTHRPTSASRKTDKRPGEVTEFHSTSNGQSRTSTDCSSQHYTGSSSSNSSSVSPRQKSKRTCPETKEIDCTTDEGFWIQKQFYHALDESSKELFDTLLEKLEKIRIATEDNAVKKQQRLVGRNRMNKTRTFQSTISTTTNDETNLQQINETNQDEQETKNENPVDENEENKAILPVTEN